jgi:hypothetical protein
VSFLSSSKHFRSRIDDNLLAISDKNLCASMSNRLDLTSHDYASGIAAALKDDYGRSASMVKDICEDTGASSGTVKNWLAEMNGPGGEHLIKLMAASPAVRGFIDRVTRREDLVAKKEQQMRRALALLEGREEP